MTRVPRVSICIPVFNCGVFISEALNSIFVQDCSAVEVIVYDGASTDNTSEVLAPYVDAHPNLTYVRADERGGIDVDLALSATYATGEYVWFFSGDDVMRPGAIDSLLSWMGKGADVILCEHTLCDIHMNVLRAYPLTLPDTPHLFDFGHAAQRLAWLELARSSESFFSFLSGVAVRRETLMRGTLLPQFARSCWGLASRLMQIAAAGQLTIQYVAEIWLDRRGENDSFLEHGVVHRYSIAVDGYQRIADYFYGPESPEKLQIRRVLRREFGLLMFFNAKEVCRQRPDSENERKLDDMFYSLYSDGSFGEWFRRALYRTCPVAVFSFTFTRYKKLRAMGRSS